MDGIAMTSLTEEERAFVRDMAGSRDNGPNHMLSVCEAIAQHFKAAGRAAGIIECSSLCGRRSQQHKKCGFYDDDIAMNEAAACATACRALLKESE